MKRKFIWVVVSGLVVVAMLLAACAPAPEKKEAAPVAPAAPVVKEAAPVAKEAAPVAKEAAPAAETNMVKVTLTKLDGTKMEKLVEKPKYGGTLVVMRTTNVLAWDEAYQAPWTSSPSLSMTNQDLIQGDWMRGAAGTGERSWIFSDTLSPVYASGELAESWEFPEPGTIIVHIRKGVRYALDPKSEASRLVNGREFTADDVVFNLRRIYIDIPTSTMYGMCGPSRPTDVYAKDKYTVVVKAPPLTTGKTWEEIGELTKMVPPEVVKKYGDMNKWENVVGTGPFILTDFVPMSSITWKRNPNHWQYDPVLGPDYPLPYVDTLKSLVIADMSTAMAAVRTGKLDLPASYPKEDFAQILRTRPDMPYVTVRPTGCEQIGWRIDKPELPYKDIRVRKALIMAVDNQHIVDTYFGGDAEPLTYKASPVSPYLEMGWSVPVAQLPPEIKEIYTYNPLKAKQLMTEAGYPNGFKSEVVISGASPETIDMMQIVKEFWMKNLNVDLKLDIKDFGVFMSIYQKKTHEHSLILGRGSMVTSMYMCRTNNMYNWGMVDDPKIEEFYQLINGTYYFDEAKRNATMRQMNDYVLSQAWYYARPRSNMYQGWQPWVKNYAGETGPGYYSGGQMWKYLWVDQALKKSMGY